MATKQMVKHSKDERRRFAAKAAQSGDQTVAKQANVTAETVARWRKEFGISSQKGAKRASAQIRKINLSGEGHSERSASDSEMGRVPVWVEQSTSLCELLDTSLTRLRQSKHDQLCQQAKSDLQRQVSVAAHTWGLHQGVLQAINAEIRSNLQSLGDDTGVAHGDAPVVMRANGQKLTLTRGADRERVDDAAVWKTLDNQLKHCDTAQEAAELIAVHRSGATGNVRWGTLRKYVDDIEQFGQFEVGSPVAVPCAGSDRVADGRSLGKKEFSLTQKRITKKARVQHVVNLIEQKEHLTSAHKELTDVILQAHLESRDNVQAQNEGSSDQMNETYILDVQGDAVCEIKHQTKMVGANYQQIVNTIAERYPTASTFALVLRDVTRDKWKKTDVTNTYRSYLPGLITGKCVSD